METQINSRDFNQNPTAVKKKAKGGPVIITDRGEAAFVVMK